MLQTLANKKRFDPEYLATLDYNEDVLLGSEILDMDSYKLIHATLAKMLGMEAALSYVEPRIKGENIKVVGRQIRLMDIKPITMEQIDEAEKFFALHIQDGEKYFPREDWETVVREYGGYVPIKVRGIPEGAIIPSSLAVTTYEVDEPDHPELSWMAAYFETPNLRGEWYPITVASKSLKIRERMMHYLDLTSDIDKKIAVMFMYHDFGARGVSSKQSAGIGACAHLATGAMGTDTVTGILYAKKYYNARMAAYSVFATEHSIMCLRGKDGELKTVRACIDAAKAASGGKPHTIVSLVSDGYSIYDLVEHYCTTLKDEILNAGINLVIRPDSGDKIKVILWILNRIAQAYGYTVNSKGYKVVNMVRILQGDGLTDFDDFEEVFKAVTDAGYSLENMVFGQGGGLLQCVNRDDLKFAQKTCAAKISGKWIGVQKDPVTDQGKKSKIGRLTTVKLADGTLASVDRDNIPEGAIDLFVDIWYKGIFYRKFTFDEVCQNNYL